MTDTKEDENRDRYRGDAEDDTGPFCPSIFRSYHGWNCEAQDELQGCLYHVEKEARQLDAYFRDALKNAVSPRRNDLYCAFSVKRLVSSRILLIHICRFVYLRVLRKQGGLCSTFNVFFPTAPIPSPCVNVGKHRHWTRIIRSNMDLHDECVGGKILPHLSPWQCQKL